MKTCSILTALFLLAGIASGELHVEGNNTGTPVVGDLVSYTIHLVGNDLSEAASSFDGRFDGPMSQVWVMGFLPTPTMDNAGYLPPADLAKDSHILLGAAQMAVVRAANEDNTGGIGSWLANSATVTMAFGIVGTAQLVDLPFAQIVVPNPGWGEGQNHVHMTGHAAKRGGGGVPIDVWIPEIPEPATLGLLGLGLLGLLRRRR
jgi:hypothetical protein